MVTERKEKMKNNFYVVTERRKYFSTVYQF